MTDDGKKGFTRCGGVWLAAAPANHYGSPVNTVEEIERVIEKLPPQDFARLSKWMTQGQLHVPQEAGVGVSAPFRDHRAFLSSYSPEDEGLYDDAASR